MIAALVAGALAGYGIAVPVGAVATYLVALTARTSWSVGACAALGVATADGLYALVAMFGGSAVTPVLRPIVAPLHLLSAFVLLALAVHATLAALRRHASERQTTSPETERAGASATRTEDPVAVEPPGGGLEGGARMTGGRAYLVLLGITVLNPGTIVYFTALVLGDRSADARGLVEQVAFVGAAFVTSASWQLVVAGSGAILGRLLTSARGRLLTSFASSAVITLLALHLLVPSL